MNESIGNKIRKKREELNLDLSQVAENLKIRVEYLKAIENNNFKIFNSDTYAKGFIQNYCKFLGLNSESFLAIYRRDIENLAFVEKQNLTSKFNNSGPGVDLKRSFGILFIFFSILFTLLIIANLFKSPEFKIYSPFLITSQGEHNFLSNEKVIIFKGETSKENTIKFNGKRVNINANNEFESDIIPLNSDKNIILVEIITNIGVTSKIIINIEKENLDFKKSEDIAISGIVQMIGSESNVKITLDNNVVFNEKIFLNDSFPIVAKESITVEASNPENIDIYINGKKYKIVEKFLNAKVINSQVVVEY